MNFFVIILTFLPISVLLSSLQVLCHANSYNDLELTKTRYSPWSVPDLILLDLTNSISAESKKRMYHLRNSIVTQKQQEKNVDRPLQLTASLASLAILAVVFVFVVTAFTSLTGAAFVCLLVVLFVPVYWFVSSAGIVIIGGVVCSVGVFGVVRVVRVVGFASVFSVSSVASVAAAVAVVVLMQ